jgi:BON domain
MKTLNCFVWMTPLIVLIAGCAAPVTTDHTYAEWEHEGLLPPTGSESTQVYSEPQTYPNVEPGITVQTDRRETAAGDLALADSIRQQFEYDRGLAPSLQHVTVQVRNGRVILQGSVRSDLDQRVIVDNLRDVTGVTRITDNLEINPNPD